MILIVFCSWAVRVLHVTRREHEHTHPDLHIYKYTRASAQEHAYISTCALRNGCGRRVLARLTEVLHILSDPAAKRIGQTYLRYWGCPLKNVCLSTRLLGWVSWSPQTPDLEQPVRLEALGISVWWRCPPTPHPRNPAIRIPCARHTWATHGNA